MNEIINKSLSIVENSKFFNKYVNKNQGYKISDTDNTTYFSNKEKGILFIFNESNILTSIHLYGERHEDYHTFIDELPYNINIYDSLSEVYNKFGNNEVDKGGGDIIPILGKSNLWSKFLIEDHYFRFEFRDNRIILISLQTW